MKERRKFIRFITYMDVFYGALGSHPSTINARLGDISREGLRLLGESALTKGSYIEMEIGIPGEDRYISARGEIRWSKKLDTTYYDTGMHFTEIQDHDKARLLDYAYDEWMKAQRQKSATT